MFPCYSVESCTIPAAFLETECSLRQRSGGALSSVLTLGQGSMPAGSDSLSLTPRDGKTKASKLKARGLLPSDSLRPVCWEASKTKELLLICADNTGPSFLDFRLPGSPLHSLLLLGKNTTESIIRAWNRNCHPFWVD